MQSKGAILAAMAGTAAASVSYVNVLKTLHVDVPVDLSRLESSNPKSARDIFRRDWDDRECLSSIESFAASVPTPSQDVMDWFETAPEPTDPCTLVADASVSENLVKFLTEIVEWAYEKEDDVQEIISNCDAAGEAVDPSEAANELLGATCSTVGNLVFTSGNATQTVPVDDLLASATATGGSDSGSGSGSDSDSDSDSNTDSGAESRKAGAAAAAALVGVVGLALAL